MRPEVWQPPVAPSRLEQAVMQRVKRARLFVWLRQHRHELLDEGFQAELAGMYDPRPLGQPPVPPALLALATILQAYVGCSDDEVLEATVMDRRWQLVLDWMDQAEAPFSKGTLVSFRARLIASELDRRLLERTVELYAQQAGGPAAGKLRAALDASPLWGAGRVEDTINLVGHALLVALGVLGSQQGWGLAAAERARVLASQAGIGVLAGSSVKAALDLDWDDPTARERALGVILAALGQVQQLAGALPGRDDPPVVAALAAARQVRDQDTTVDSDGVVQIRPGVARDRRISIADAQMRHGRKTRSLRVDGYKRHVLRDLDSGLVRVVGLTPANLPEAEVAAHIRADLDAQGAELGELHIDRAYLASALVRDRDPELAVYCKAFPARAPGGRFAKPAFVLDFDQHTLTCPNNVTMPFTAGAKVQFPAGPARPARCGSGVRPAREGAASRSTPMSGSWSSCAPASRPHRGGRGCASAPRLSTPWRMSAAGRATAPATSGSARTCSTYAGSQSSTTSTSSPANPHQSNKPPEPAT